MKEIAQGHPSHEWETGSWKPGPCPCCSYPLPRLTAQAIAGHLLGRARPGPHGVGPLPILPAIQMLIRPIDTDRR